MVKIKKIRCSSMPEVLVAMTILVVIMLIAFSVLASVNNYTNPSFKLNALMECNLLINDTNYDLDSRDTIKKGNIRIVRHVELYRENSNLCELNLTALAPNGLILCRRNLVISKEVETDED